MSGMKVRDTKLLSNTDEKIVGINSCNMRDKIKTMCLLVHCVLFKNARFVTWQPHWNDQISKTTC